MGWFILRRIVLLFLTMAIVSVGVFIITEASPGNVARNLLGSFVTPEQEASFLNQLGLDEPLWKRYFYWLAGTDWHASRRIGLPLERLTTQGGFTEWWARLPSGHLVRWELKGEDLIAIVRTKDGRILKRVDNGRWRSRDDGSQFFWGVDLHNRAVLWEKGLSRKQWVYVHGKGWTEAAGGATDYIPLKKGFLRGDPGMSLRTGRPVAKSLFVRLRNSLVLASIAFVIVMPIALALGIIAGLTTGRAVDRTLSVAGMIFSVIPEFAMGIFLILIFALWLRWLPGASVFGDHAPWERPDMLVLPVLTLTLIELGYVLRITRASMVEVMRSPYIRTALLKGLPYRVVVFKHAIRNALIAPITVMMLHVNWLLGGVVVVEVVFGYPGLGKYLLDSAMYKDINALEAGAMIMVVVAVGTQLVADIAYTFLNPRIRFK
ncbi:ABC transporter permease [Thermodesulforhabdus norvegica]|uniref:Peptide/nickel transport system permease protein n=1 Tax=Thermodesulforhabdus norvegica TaxID=39841 RepID=A0A1I4U762_9BACT|nr:ABC transporter permease [Thermodesulforhabdus norvegica]SFM84797.1 peptide/nickel transport system permease protein [Thermodesulforhabdus norvegica]